LYENPEKRKAAAVVHDECNLGDDVAAERPPMK
jgi:hypothetical protein